MTTPKTTTPVRSSELFMPRFVKAMSKVEAALMELEIVCQDEALKRETRAIREAYTQRRSALGQLTAKRHNAEVSRGPLDGPTTEPAELSYEDWLESLALGCNCEDGPCGGCMQGSICDSYSNHNWECAIMEIELATIASNRLKNKLSARVTIGHLEKAANALRSECNRYGNY